MMPGISFKGLPSRLLRRAIAPLLCAVLLSTIVPVPGLVPSSASAAVALPPLSSPPLGARWFTLTMNGDRTGFGFVRVIPASGGYEITAEGSAKMVVLGFSREAASRERYLVNRDLSLRSFNVDQIIDGSAMKVSGEVTAKGIKVLVETKGSRKERVLKAKGAVYPSAVLNVYPLMHGVTPGRKYRVNMLDVEAVKMKDVSITAVGFETLENGVKALHLQNDLYSFVSNDVWVDLVGNTLRESVRDGMIETRAEEEGTARRFVVESALAKKDLILDFSRVTVDPPLEKPEDMVLMKLELSGFPANVPVLQGAGQRSEPAGPEKVIFTVCREGCREQQPAAPDPAYLSSSVSILADNREIVSLKDDILKGERDPARSIRILAEWVAKNVKDSVTDSQSPVETLASRNGNCQSHARLYVSLARAAGIPSRFVSGLVYVPGQGFLYHSWGESFVGGWVPVDPTFDEVPANATHVKLVEGESPQEMMPIIGLIGNIRAKVLEKKYRND